MQYSPLSSRWTRIGQHKSIWLVSERSSISATAYIGVFWNWIEARYVNYRRSRYTGCVVDLEHERKFIDSWTTEVAGWCRTFGAVVGNPFGVWFNEAFWFWVSFFVVSKKKKRVSSIMMKFFCGLWFQKQSKLWQFFPELSVHSSLESKLTKRVILLVSKCLKKKSLKVKN